MCFDTTSSNTGLLKGACPLIEQSLEHKVLWTACRHHILEIVASSTFSIAINEKSSSPNIDIFTDFRKKFNELEKNTISPGITDERVSKVFPKKQRKILTDFLKAQLQLNHQRSDYHDLIILALLFLGENINNGFVPAPGAVHRARWMGRIIGCIRIYLFRQQYQLSPEIMNGIREFVCFILKIYIKYWFTCENAINAPKNDIDFLNDINGYKNVNELLSAAALKAMSRHSWYLNEHNIALAFFDKRIDSSIKKKMVLNLSKESSNTFTPRPTITLQKHKKLNIYDFVSKNTMNFFDILEISHEFLKEHPRNWMKNETFNNIIEQIRNIKVVNDLGERMVSLMSEYNNVITTQEDQRQYMLQVVEHHRKTVSLNTKSNIVANIKKIET